MKKIRKNGSSLTTLVLILIALIYASCKKLIEVSTPVNTINSANVYSTDATAAAVLTGLYTKLSRDNIDGMGATGYLASIYTGPGLSSDELTLFDETNSNYDYNLFYANELTSLNAPGYWTTIYPDIYTVNAAIEGITASSTLTAAVKQQLLGEAKFMRAFYYFYLVNFYGDVPLALSTDYSINRLLSRTSKRQVYEQILADLSDAKELLNQQYLGGDVLSPVTERVRPNKAVATALLSRVHLYMGSEGDNSAWRRAEEQATILIANTVQYDTVALDGVFLNRSKEAIWQLQPVKAGVNANTGEGKFFVLLPEGPGNAYPIYLSDHIISSFEIGDMRKSNWTGNVTVGGKTYYYPFKYKIGQGVNVASTEFSTIFRLAEQYLIRAEARAQQGNVSGAAADLNVIRKRARLQNTNSETAASLLDAIAREREVELFTEGGHRWFDLKRTGKADVVLKPIKGSSWQSTDQLYPIPALEIAKSPALQGHQNPGYQ
nr:RagB/SusD family nutrient uptake outer membrane protein [Pedobacter panaciterrae]